MKQITARQYARQKQQDFIEKLCTRKCYIRRHEGVLCHRFCWSSLGADSDVVKRRLTHPREPCPESQWVWRRFAIDVLTENSRRVR